MLLVALGTAAASAQRRGRGRFFEPIKSPTPDTFQGSFNFCRVMFSQAYDGFGGNWAVDYPRADVNLSIRLSELTKTRISTDTSGEPDHVVIGLNTQRQDDDNDDEGDLPQRRRHAEMSRPESADMSERPLRE